MEQPEFFLTQTQVLKYKHIPAGSMPIKKAEGACYFYVGKNFRQISALITGFDDDFSYHSDSFTQVPAILSRLERSGEPLPDVILFDGTCQSRELNAFFQAAKKEKWFRYTLMIAEVGTCTQQQLSFLKRSSFIDDMIVLDRSKDSLKQKVDFLRRVKSEQAPDRLKDRLNVGTMRENLLKYAVKRLFDIIISSVLILFLLPVFLLVGLAIKLESGGPVFYISPRAGRGYQIFKFIKFRTMVPDADKKVLDLLHLNQYAIAGEQPVFFKVNNDPRVTRVGAFLRNTSLDELPQLFNVFMGDMSLVGNRPLPLYEAATLTTDEFAARFMAPAGITGLWQIKKRGEANISVEERIHLDIDYANKYGFMYDLWIIMNTPSALVQKVNV